MVRGSVSQARVILVWAVLLTATQLALSTKAGMDAIAQELSADPNPIEVAPSLDRAPDFIGNGWKPLDRIPLPTRIALAVWTYDERLLLKPEPPERAWRTTFGAERQTDPLDALSAAIVDADVIAIRRIDRLKALFRLFPAREFFVIPSIDLKRSALQSGASEPVGARNASGLGVAIRRNSGLRVSKTIQLTRSAARHSGLPQDGLAVRLRSGRIAFWLVISDQAEIESWISRLEESGVGSSSHDVVAVTTAEQDWESTTSGNLFPIPVHGPQATGIGCRPPRISIARWRGNRPAPDWHEAAGWNALSANTDGQSPCIAILRASLRHARRDLRPAEIGGAER